jgi:hypothetical protein
MQRWSPWSTPGVINVSGSTSIPTTFATTATTGPAATPHLSRPCPRNSKATETAGRVPLPRSGPYPGQRLPISATQRICAGQSYADGVPPADEEPPGVVLAEETGLLLKAWERAPELGKLPARRPSLTAIRSEAKCFLTPSSSHRHPRPDQLVRNISGPACA